MREFASLEEMRACVGQEVAVSDWVEISQQRIGLFAEATDDHQWIHTDPARAAAESPFGGTVAHGFLTLSLLPALLAKALHMVDMKMGLNYGLNKVRFPAPVPSGSRVRARITLAGIEDVAGGAQLAWHMTVEREGGDKPVCIAEFLVRRY
jgi:acyl dehydratase